MPDKLSEPNLELRIKDYFRRRTSHTAKLTLKIIESELKEYNIDKKFFDTNNNGGFMFIRNLILDQLADLQRNIEIMVDSLEIEPKNAKILLPKEISDDKTEGKN